MSHPQFIAPQKSRYSRGERQSSVQVYDYGLLLLLAMIWGSSFLLQKVAVSEVTPVLMTAIRQILAAALLGLVVLFAGLKIKASAKEHWLMFLSAILGNALPFSLISIGLQDIDSGLAAILMGAMPLVTILLAHFTSHDEPLNRSKLLAVGIGILGLIVLFWPSLVSGLTANLTAQLLVLGAALCYAFNTLVTKSVIHLEAPVLLFMIVMWSAVILVPAAWVMEDIPMVLPGSNVIWSIIGLAVFPTAIAAFLMYEVIARQGAGFFGQINLLVPICGVFWGFAFLGERLSWNAWAALLIILSGVAVSRNWNSNQKVDNNSAQT
ncbi:MAG: DMT family transporter [Salaquimonas sp.]